VLSGRVYLDRDDLTCPVSSLLKVERSFHVLVQDGSPAFFLVGRTLGCWLELDVKRRLTTSTGHLYLLEDM